MKILLNLLSLFLLTVIAGCAQTMSSSEIELDISEQSDNKVQHLNSIIMKKVEQEGGECEVFRKEPIKYHCTFPNSTLRVNFGFLRKDKDLPNPSYYIFVNSNYVHILPPTEKAVVNGSYLLKKHADLESWILSNIPNNIKVKEKNRIYHGYDTTIAL